MKEIKNVVILGGGTAGWLAAYIMSDFFYSNKLNANVKVIESSKIPTIGVGEGTTSIFYEFLKKYNLDETDFLKESKTLNNAVISTGGGVIEKQENLELLRNELNVIFLKSHYLSILLIKMRNIITN